MPPIPQRCLCNLTQPTNPNYLSFFVFWFLSVHISVAAMFPGAVKGILFDVNVYGPWATK